jgi:hypothetical protein
MTLNELSLKASDFKGAEDFDALLRANFDKQQLAVHLDGGKFYTQGTREWDDSSSIAENPGFRIRNWTLDSQSGATLAWDHSKVTPTDVPIALIRTTEMRFDGQPHTPEEIWAGQPRGQSVRDLQFDLQFSTALPRWKAAGKMLRIGAVALGGHQGAIERCHLTDWGAWGYEGFPLAIMGAFGPDKNAIAILDPTTHVFDQGVTDSECSHITDCLADGFDETLTNDQVTVRMITGSMGCPTGDLNWWAQTPRAYAYQRGNRTIAQGRNIVQAHTIYNSLRGDIDHNTSQGAAVGVYGDFCKNKGLHIWLNQFLNCDYAGIRFFLSPGDPKTIGNLAEQFSHEDYDIGPNQVTSRSGVQVDFGTFEDQLPLGAMRFIRNMKVDASLLLEAKGTIPGIVRTGQVAASAKGCNPFHR